MQRKTVVLVCMVDSIHVARWIAQFDPTEVKFILFPSGPNRRVHPKIVDMIARGEQFDNQMTMVPFGGKLSLSLWALDRFFSDRIRGLLLRRVLKKVQPDFVHALEFQHAGYVTIRALEDKSIKTPFIATNYGSDIYWFQRFAKHKAKIQRILDRADLYSAECLRDVDLARGLGFSGKVLPVIPNSGGLMGGLNAASTPAPSNRKTIAVKGYDSWSGRASLARGALAQLGFVLRNHNYVVEVYSASRRTHLWAIYMKVVHRVPVKVHGKGRMTHSKMLELFARSRVYLGVSRTDGLSTSMIEAMSCGAFPIQTSTACLSGFLEDGVNGFSINKLSIEEVLPKLLRALTDNGLVDVAYGLNRELCEIHFESSRISELAQIFYQDVA